MVGNGHVNEQVGESYYDMRAGAFVAKTMRHATEPSYLIDGPSAPSLCPLFNVFELSFVLLLKQ